MAFPRRVDIEMALLRVLHDAGGALPASEAIARVTAAFPQLTPEDLRARQPSGHHLKWPNLVRWVRQHLVLTGAIDRSVRGVWALTEAGRALVAAAESAAAPPAAGSPRTPRPPARAKSAPQARILPAIQPLPARLRAAAHSGTDATAFEEALAEAFRELGFEVVQIGGRSDTDVLVRAPLGKDAYVAVVDAKSSRTGKVPDTAINFASLRDHKERNRADYVMVIAPAFRKGKVVAHAEREEVVLMELEPFLRVLEIHQRTPLSLLTLRELFVRPGLYGSETDRIEEAGEHVARLATLLPLVIRKIEHWYRLGLHAPVTADGLFIALIEELREPRFAKDMIDAALQYLASPFVGALRKNETGYYLTMPYRTVQQRLFSLGEHFREQARTGASGALDRRAGERP